MDVSRLKILRILVFSAALFPPGVVLGETPDLNEAERATARRALSNWYGCGECTEADLKAVTRHGEAVVPELIATLTGGPASAGRELLRHSLNEVYDGLVEQARERPDMKPASSREQFAARYLGGYDVLYRIQAARALKEIGGQDARAALQAALDHDRQAPQVRTVIRQLLEQR